jgi:anti-sigma regulatory factor (Ser/Thr protein kinase)
MLVCYTDGLVESSRDFEAGLARLNAVVSDHSVTTERHPAAAIAERMLPDGAHDDVAVLTLMVVPSAQRASSIARWSFPHLDADGLHALRKEFRAALVVREYGEAGLATAELVLGELLGNVIRHAPGQVRIALDTSLGDGVLHVIDDGPGFERAPMLPIDPMSESGRGLFIIAQLTREFSVTRRHPRGSHARALLAGNPDVI